MNQCYIKQTKKEFLSAEFIKFKREREEVWLRLDKSKSIKFIEFNFGICQLVHLRQWHFCDIFFLFLLCHLSRGIQSTRARDATKWVLILSYNLISKCNRLQIKKAHIQEPNSCLI